MRQTNTNRKTIIAGIIGNVMEWYDFAIYGYFAPIIGAHFFPSDDAATSVIAAFGVFAAGFLMRPFGSIVFGHIGDRIGRKAALTLSVILMAIPTFLIGVLPDYVAIGIAAPALLVAMRLLQGLSVGGEYTTSIVFLVEHAPKNRRALTGCWSIWGAVAGVLLGSAIGALISNLLTAEEVSAWGWRVPFLLGIAIGLSGLYIRRHVMEETTLKEDRPKSPVIEAFRTEWRTMLQIAGFNVVNAVGFYMIFVYAVTWLKETAHVTTARALDINSLNMLLMLLMIPLAALMADRFGRKVVLMSAMIGIVLFSYPLFWLMHHGADGMTFLGQFGFALLISMIFGSYPTMMVDMVAPRLRVSTISIGYNLSLGILGGTTPMVAAYLVARTHVDLSPAFYLMGAAIVSLLVLRTIKETVTNYREPINSD
ncbi:MAG: MFS transporter [Rhodospirillaceae bacterium]|nr:MAG: MFS transporter [Rhodospirillaceae bacterium]